MIKSTYALHNVWVWQCNWLNHLATPNSQIECTNVNHLLTHLLSQDILLLCIDHSSCKYLSELISTYMGSISLCTTRFIYLGMKFFLRSILKASMWRSVMEKGINFERLAISMISVTGWNYSFNILPFTTSKISPITFKIYQNILKFCKILNKPSKSCQRLSKYCLLSGILPHLVTLSMTCSSSRASKQLMQ